MSSLGAAILLVLAGSGLAGRWAASQTPDQSVNPPRRIRVGGEVELRMLVHRVKPKYPESAKKAGIKGTVRLQIIVDRDGRVIEVKPLEGDPELAQAASDAVRQWRFKPVTLNGVPVQVDTRVELTFH